MWICFRIVCLKAIDTGASSWLFYFCILILARHKNENSYSEVRGNRSFTVNWVFIGTVWESLGKHTHTHQLILPFTLMTVFILSSQLLLFPQMISYEYLRNFVSIYNFLCEILATHIWSFWIYPSWCRVGIVKFYNMQTPSSLLCLPSL